MAEWWRIELRADPLHIDAIAAFIVSATGNGVEEPSENCVTTTLDSEGGADELVQAVQQAFAGTEATVIPMEATDWSMRWRDGIATREIGRLSVTPSWIPVLSTPGKFVITIDPESAFGSGEHGSTRGALVLLERYLKPNARVLDLGSGSGILSIAAALLGARTAIGIEMAADDIAIADANAARNGVDDRVVFLSGDAGELAPLAGPADLICSNILRSVNTLLLPAIRTALAPDGIVIFAGMEDVEAELFKPVLAANNFAIFDEVRDGSWWSIAVRQS